jgi:hypothetical protein
MPAGRRHAQASRRPPKAVCRQCGRMSRDLYWQSPHGRPIKEPYCARCYGDALRRLMREETEEHQQLLGRRRSRWTVR